jgi:hypothetical protein
MWDSLGKSVDINLDNLSRHSKGNKSTASNVPMNLMMSNQPLATPNKTVSPPFGTNPLSLTKTTSNVMPANGNQFNFSTPPMSPKINLTATQPATNIAPTENKSMNLLDF